MRLMPMRGAEVDTIWPEVCDYLEAACAEGTGEFNADTLRVLCRSGDALLSVVVGGAFSDVCCAVVTQMVVLPDTSLRCDLLACGGTGMRDWISLLREIEQGARRNGASSVRFLGRTGWARVLPDYDVRQLVFEKDLRH